MTVRGHGNSRDGGGPDNWSARAPFSDLPPHELAARRSVVARQTPSPHIPIDDVCVVTRSLADSRVTWLVPAATQLWPLLAVWPQLHWAATSLDRLIPQAATNGFLRSIVGEVRRTVVKRVASTIAIPADADDPDAAAGHDALNRYQDIDSALEFAGENPDVVAYVRSVLDRHVRNVTEMISVLPVDAALIRSQLHLGDDLDVVGVMARGDLHEAGAVLEVVLGDGARVMYKPRSLALESELSALFRWLDEFNAVSMPTVPGSVDCGDHGWQQYVTADVDTSTAALSSLGALSAAALVLGATDLHHENITFVGDRPMVIDPECFFGVSLRADRDGIDPFLGSRTETVLSSGVLPEYNSRPGVTPFDGSPLGHRRTDNTTYYHLALRRVGTATHLTPVPAESRDEARTGAGSTALNTVSVAAFVEGLDTTLRTLRRQEAACDERLSRFSRVRVRHLVRPTNAYVSMIGDLGNCEPDDAAEHREHVTNMLWPGASLGRLGEGMFLHERQTIHSALVPTFHRRAGDCTLHAGGTDAELGTLAVDGLTLARRRLRSLSDSEIRAQVAIARMALELASPCDDAAQTPRTQPSRSHPSMRTVVGRVMADLAADAVVHRDRIWWPVAHCVAPGKFTPKLAPHGLYEGPAGIALVANLARAADPDATIDASLTDGALLAMQSDTRHLVEASSPHQLARAGNLGVFDGIWGAVYSAHVIGSSTSRPDLVQWARDIAARTVDSVDMVKTDDFTNGIAGLLCVSAQLERATGDDVYQDVTSRAFARLIALSAEQLAYRSVEAGLAHGLSGQILAFSRTASIDRVAAESRAAIELLVEVEDTFAIPGGATRWADHNASDLDAKIESWCRGAAGIAIARRHASRVGVGEPSTADLALSAATSTISRAPAWSLCHGRVGIALSAVSAAGAAETRDAVARLEEELVLAYRTRSRTGRWPLGPGMTSGGGGLMCGYTGVALAALVVLAQQNAVAIPIPDVLSLAIGSDR